MGLSIFPLVQVYGTAVAYDALIASGFAVGGLTAFAYNAPSE